MELSDLYQEVILDHSKRPRNYGELENADHSVQADNPLCGDELTVHLKLSADGKTIDDVRFTGQGCAISQASASMMTSKIKGLPVRDALSLGHALQEILTAENEPGEEAEPPNFGDLALLRGVRSFPARVKCATLAWNALKQGLAENEAGC